MGLVAAALAASLKSILRLTPMIPAAGQPMTQAAAPLAEPFGQAGSLPPPPPLTVALAKGALLKDSVRRFAAAGLDFGAILDPANRQLMVPSACGGARALLVRNADVPVYVAYGQAQLGVVGLDVLKEHQLPVAQLVDLGFGGCRMSVAVKASSPYRRAADLPAHCRVASKFTRCAEAYFAALDLPVEVVHLAGSVELGPITGMSEAIVDLVATGRTLQENGLIAIEDLFQSSARLVGHPLALRLDDGRLRAIVERIRAVSSLPVPA
jgi:ATP phosphoribosyltransferase